MLYTEKLPIIEVLPIAKVQPGQIIANLGEVLETEECLDFFSFVIRRMNENQVLKFEKNLHLIIMVEDAVSYSG